MCHIVCCTKFIADDVDRPSRLKKKISPCCCQSRAQSSQLDGNQTRQESFHFVKPHHQ